MADKRKKTTFKKYFLEYLTPAKEEWSVILTCDPMPLGLLSAILIKQGWLTDSNRLIITLQPACIEYVIAGQNHKTSIPSYFIPCFI